MLGGGVGASSCRHHVRHGLVMSLCPVTCELWRPCSFWRLSRRYLILRLEYRDHLSDSCARVVPTTTRVTLARQLCPQEKKACTADFVNMIVAATDVKSGGGRGKRTEKFSAIQHMKVDSKIQRKASGSKAAFRTYYGCCSYWQTEFQWTSARCMDEWKYLQSTLDSADQDRTWDRVSGKAVEWICIDLERYKVRENVREKRDDAVQIGARSTDSHSVFSDPLSHGTMNSNTTRVQMGVAHPM